MVIANKYITDESCTIGDSSSSSSVFSFTAAINHDCQVNLKTAQLEIKTLAYVATQSRQWRTCAADILNVLGSYELKSKIVWDNLESGITL